jgi:hypothetical protein
MSSTFGTKVSLISTKHPKLARVRAREVLEKGGVEPLSGLGFGAHVGFINLHFLFPLNEL